MIHKALPKHVQALVQAAKNSAKLLAEHHKLEVGVAEMAIGAAIVYWGVQHGVAQMGVDLVATHLNVGMGVGGGLMGTAMAVVGSIGIVGMGGAIGVPAAVLAGGAALLLGSMGYTVGDIVGDLIDPSWLQLLEGPAIALFGVALLVEGARRICGDARVSKVGARASAAALHLRDCNAQVVARTLEELLGVAMGVFSAPKDAADAAGSIGSAAIAGAGGFAAGSAISAAGLTFAGSHALGGMALSLGLISAPVWPAVAAALAVGGVGFAAWKLVNRVRSASQGEQQTLLIA